MYAKMQQLGFTLLVGLFTAAFPAAATSITTNSYSTWNTSSYIITADGTTLVDLSTLNAGTNYSTAAGYSANGFTFTGPDGAGYYLYAETFSSHTGLAGKSDGIGVIQVSMPNGGSSAFFFDAVCESSCGSLSLTLSDGETFTSSTTGGFGISVSHDVTWFDLSTSSGNQAFLEYVYFGTSSLPQDSSGANEAATPVLVGGGLMLLFGAVRKKVLRRP